jgi:hypothetical protein
VIGALKMTDINKLIFNLDKALEETEKALISARRKIKEIEKEDIKKIEKKLQKLDIEHTIWLHEKEGIK